MVNPIIAVRFGNDGGPTHRWRVRSSPVATKWLASLRSAIPHGINERTRIYNMPLQPWNRNNLCMEMVSCMQRIESFYPGFFSTWPYPEMSHDTTNAMHLAFEHLRGSIDQPSELYSSAPHHIQMEICRYNVLIHRWESFVMKGPPRVVCTFNRPFREPLAGNDFDEFGISHGYGAMLINYPQVGKQLLDVFRDDDAMVSPEAIRPMDRYAAGFVLRFAEITAAAAASTMAAFGEWFGRNHAHLSSLGFKLGDPRLAIGYIQVADLMETGDRTDMLEGIGRAGRIDDVWIED